MADQTLIDQYILQQIYKANRSRSRRLDLSRWKIEILPEELFNLDHLYELILANCGLRSLSPKIAYLKNLRALDISSNSLASLPVEMMRLRHLRFLNLSRNRGVRDFEPLRSLQGLDRLDLSSLQLKEIPEPVFDLKDLPIINLDGNELTSLPAEIRRMEGLRVLRLSSNKMKGLHPNIGYLHHLRVLDLRHNQLSRLPKEIRHLRQLKKLNLSFNHFDKFPKILRELDHIKNLDLGGNKIRDLPKLEGKLNKLEFINLSFNVLSRVDDEITKLPNLRQVGLFENPISFPPLEIVSQGWEAMKNYYKEVQQDTADYLYEVKLLLVGEGRVGKTSLSKSLSLPSNTLTDEKSTEGIEIKQWIIPAQVMGLEKDFRINIWDFGGQEIYHATHQFFLTRRSLYLFVTESRQEDKPEDIFYWLNIIRLLGDKSPVIIVLNKCDEPNTDIPINQYRSMFDNIVDFKKVSSKAGYEDTIETLRAEIRRLITAKKLLPHIGTPLPRVWVDIRWKLEEMKKLGKNYISFNEYLRICERFRMDETRAKWLSQFFHDLGVVLHFQDDHFLANTVILNHEWVTKGVYNVLDNPNVIANFGRFNNEDLALIWKDAKYKDKRGELLSLMKNRKFELCFELDNGDYLAPQLLPKDQASFEWRSNKDNLQFELLYEFMPKGILTRFIVKQNKIIYKNTYWRYGVLLSDDDTRALVQEKYLDRKITIRLEGPNKRELLAIIRRTFTDIHSQYKNLDVHEMIPCNCDTCKNNPDPTFFKYSTLKQYQREGIPTIDCTSGKIKRVDVNSLISDVFERAKSNSERLAEFQAQQPIIIVEKGDVNMSEKHERNVEIGGSVEMTGGVLNTGEMKGPVNSGSGKLVGRDDNSRTGLDGEEVKLLFEGLFAKIDQAPRLSEDEKTDLKTDVNELREELAKKEEADETFLMRRLRSIGRMAPEILEVTLATITNPVVGFGLIAKKVAEKARASGA